MSLVVEGQTYQWEGGTLEELLSLLAEMALSVRVETIHPEREEKLGEIHIVAGGVSETIAGDRRGDTAMTHLRQIAGLRFLVHPMLPDPEEAALGKPGPLEGTLAERPVPQLMRYCENFVLTCAVEIRHGDDHVRISYRRGEILRTLVNGSESGERLAEVMSWTDGTWRITMPQLALPRPHKTTRPVRSPASTLDSSTIFGYQVAPPPPVVMTPAPAPASPPAAAAVIGTVTAAPPAANANAAPSAAAAAEPTSAPSQRRGTDGPTPAVETVGRMLAPVTVEPASRGAPARAPEKADGQLKATPPVEEISPSSSTQPVRTRNAGGSLVASLFFHALLGVALGLAIVGGYWAFLRWGGTLKLG